MRAGVGSSGAVVSCLGGDGGRTPPILPGSEELDSVELAGVSGSGSSRSGRRRAKSSSVIHASSSAGRPCQCTKNLREAPSPVKSIISCSISSTYSCRSGGSTGGVDCWTNSLSEKGPGSEVRHVLATSADVVVELNTRPSPPR